MIKKTLKNSILMIVCLIEYRRIGACFIFSKTIKMKLKPTRLQPLLQRPGMEV